ncbi:MAG: alpha/beta hydrolase [Syntrophothermus sp.]
MNIHRLSVTKTARYCTIGELNNGTKEIWFICHGYGQLANEFIGDFELLDDGTRYIVAPEALSRFYLRNGLKEIGASWMTRLERDDEINDYLSFLGKVYQEVMKEANGFSQKGIRTVLLGFSQGTATATRWFESMGGNFDNLVLWGGHLASETNLMNGHYDHSDIWLIYGVEDKYLLPLYFEEDIKLLTKYSIKHRLMSFNGGHIIDGTTLDKLAKELPRSGV